MKTYRLVLIVNPVLILCHTMNYNRCLQLLQDYVWPTVHIDGLIVMEDGAPPHFALIVRVWCVKIDCYKSIKVSKLNVHIKYHH